jgi:DNA primase
LPDLQRRVCFLLALQPSVAAEPIAMEFLPRAVVDWIGRLALMPAHTHFAGLIESLRETDPGLAESLQAQATRDRGLLADLDVEAVRIEVEGALNQLRAQGVRDEVDRLAASGLQDEAARLRYAELLALRKTLSAP